MMYHNNIPHKTSQRLVALMQLVWVKKNKKISSWTALWGSMVTNWCSCHLTTVTIQLTECRCTRTTLSKLLIQEHWLMRQGRIQNSACMDVWTRQRTRWKIYRQRLLQIMCQNHMHTSWNLIQKEQTPAQRKKIQHWMHRYLYSVQNTSCLS